MVQNFLWPVPQRETQQILNDLLEIHTININEEKDIFVKNCLTTYNPFFNPYVVIFNYILLRGIKKRKIKLEYSNKSKVMSYLHGETNDFPLEVERLITKNNKNFF